MPGTVAGMDRNQWPEWTGKRSKLPEVVNRTVAAALSDRKSVKTLTEAALRVQLHLLARFLTFAEREIPELHASILSARSDPENRRTLTENTLRTRLGGLAYFFKYAEQKLPKKVYETVSSTLSDPTKLKALCESEMQVSLHGLRAFHDYARQTLPSVNARFLELLNDPANLETLVSTALQTSLSELGSFLEYAERVLPLLGTRLNKRLEEPDNIRRLADAACQCPLSALLKFLRSAPMAQSVVNAVDLVIWEKVWSGRNFEQPEAIPAIAREFERLGRAKLANAPASMVIKAAEPFKWHRPGIELAQVSHVLRLGRGVGNKFIASFLKAIITKPWLENQYKTASTGTIAASLFSLWGYMAEPVGGRFRIDALSSRVAGELEKTSSMEPAELSAALQLLGCAMLVGIDTGAISVNWPDNNRVREVLEFAAPQSNFSTIGHVQAQLWVGLREMTRLRKNSISVPSGMGEQIVDLWRNTEATTNRQEALNSSMIDWLERCANTGWVLIADNKPLTSITAKFG